MTDMLNRNNIINNNDANYTNNSVNYNNQRKRTPLHITIGTSPRVNAQYCGQLFDLFDHYEKENVELANSKSINSGGGGSGTVVRSRSKFHNFIQLHLNKPLYVSGRIVHDI